jgi:hypothetical protein
MFGTSHSRELVRPALRNAGVLLGGVALATAVAAAVAAPAGHSDARVEGEYGLFVHFTADSLIVQWLTAQAMPGALAVQWTDGPTHELATPAGTAHRAAVPRPRQTNALLRYGAAGAAPHETAISLAAPRRPPVDIRGVDSLYVVGDTHGYFDELITGLRRAGLIGEALEWTGGRRHLAFAGDLTDRGPDVMRLLWFVYRLEQQAARAGGRVHVVLGNHETMVMLGDLRYVHPKETSIAERHGVAYDRLVDSRSTVLGRWLGSKPVLIRVDGALIAHGGVAPEFAQMSLRGIDEAAARFMAPGEFYRQVDPATLSGRDSLLFAAWDDFFWHPRSILWHRGYVQSDTLGAELQEVLRLLGSTVHVVGHTAVREIHARYDGRLIAAHTPRHGAELVLLVRQRGGHQRFRIVDDGPPQPF